MVTRRHLAGLAAAGLLGWAGCATTRINTIPSSMAAAPSTAVATGAVPSSLPPSATGPAPTSAPSNPAASGEPTIPYATAQASSSAAGSGYQIASVRVGQHEAYDRVVVELRSGSGAPQWLARYVDRFATQGEGAPVALPGAGKLLLTVRGLVMPSPSDPIVKGNLNQAAGHITGIHVDPWFEGQALVMIGVDQVRPYRVFVLDSPTRIVVDIQR
ncbi:MAG TPA: hypothetical protein PKM36_04045 [Propionibacteriaceae bacterium]|nr:hypothetical protein [Propionibacteriaceae bacterium]